MILMRRALFSPKSFTMVNHSTIANILHRDLPGDSVKIKGWIKSMRKMKSNLFLDLNDGSSPRHLQVIVPQESKSYNITTGSSIMATGNLSRAPSGQLELHADKIDVMGPCIVSEGYPFAPRKVYPPEYIRQYLHLRSRTNKFASLLRIRDAINFEIHNYLHLNKFINIHTPILTSNDCEGAGEVFVVTPENKSVLKGMEKLGVPLEQAYFNSKAYLSVSGQLHLEAMVHGLNKVYTFGPTFRAENSRSRHHLSEFYMLEVEMAFVNGIDELVAFIEDLVRTVSKQILENCPHEVGVTDGNTAMYADRQYQKLSFTEASRILEKNSNKFKTAYSSKAGPSKEHEMFLVKYCQAPVFVLNWPKYMKPFYMKECPTDNEKVAALDLLGPNVGEILGGSLREDDYNKLKAKIPEDTDLSWYLDLRKFGGVPTAGFGLGLERYIQSILSINNIRDTIPFPRWAHNCSM